MVIVTDSLNSILLFEEQTRTISPNILREIGTIFNGHEACEQFGIVLLHRHHDLKDDHVWVHRPTMTRGREADVCRAEPHDSSMTLSPLTYYLDDASRWNAFEYSQNLVPPHPPAMNLLNSLSSFLIGQNLQKVLAVTHLQEQAGGDVWQEYLTRDGTVAVRKSRDERFNQDGEHVVTAWAFMPRSDGVLVVPMKECKKPDIGGHAREDSISWPEE